MIKLSAADRIALAASVGMHEQYLYQCFTERRSMPAERCPDIERASDGRVSCEDLRPDIRWHRVPDATWPHPGGRPLIDVSAPTPETAQQG